MKTSRPPSQNPVGRDTPTRGLTPMLLKVPLFARPCMEQTAKGNVSGSGVAKGSGAGGQGILTAPQEKSLKFCPSVTKRIVSYPSKPFFSHHPIFLDQSLQHTVLRPSLPN